MEGVRILRGAAQNGNVRGVFHGSWCGQAQVRPTILFGIVNLLLSNTCLWNIPEVPDACREMGLGNDIRVLDDHVSRERELRKEYKQTLWSPFSFIFAGTSWEGFIQVWHKVHMKESLIGEPYVSTRENNPLTCTAWKRWCITLATCIFCSETLVTGNNKILKDWYVSPWHLLTCGGWSL